jgi:hypothetical protein
MEVARLLEFPPRFTFPPSVADKQCYQLLGNSLQVGVAARLLEHLLTSEDEDVLPGLEPPEGGAVEVEGGQSRQGEEGPGDS